MSESLGAGHRRVRRLRRLLRARAARSLERAYVVEGPELVRTAAAAGVAVESVYVAAGADEHPGVEEAVEAARTQGARVFALADGVLERVAGTVTPQPVLAVVPMDPAGPEVLDGATLAIVCLDVRDPGNLGAILRTADAAGADALVATGGTVDVTNPKVVRASAGSLFHVPVWAGASAAEAFGALGGRGIRTAGTVRGGGVDYLAVDWTVPTALVLGNEAHGLSEDVLAQVDLAVTIPMRGRAESLNVGTACAVLCFEALRQRRTGAGGGPTISPMSPAVER